MSDTPLNPLSRGDLKVLLGDLVFIMTLLADQGDWVRRFLIVVEDRLRGDDEILV